MAYIDLRREMCHCDEKDGTLGHNPYLETDIITLHYNNYPVSNVGVLL